MKVDLLSSRESIKESARQYTTFAHKVPRLNLKKKNSGFSVAACLRLVEVERTDVSNTGKS
jgi:hypothetical protein